MALITHNWPVGIIRKTTVTGIKKTYMESELAPVRCVRSLDWKSYGKEERLRVGVLL